MKKLLLALLVLVSVAGIAWAAPAKKEKAVTIVPVVDKGVLLANAGIGYGGISGGIETTFARFDIADIFPVTIGAGARAFIDPGIFYSGFGFGVGGAATAHFGFKSLSLPSGMAWLGNVDSYIALGLGFGGWASYSTAAFGFCTFDGVSYYLNDKLALNVEYGHMGNGWYSTFGAILKL